MLQWIKNLLKKDLKISQIQEEQIIDETRQFLKIRGTNIYIIDEKEATDLLKSNIFYTENDFIKIRIYDLDKYNPQQIIDFLMTSRITKTWFMKYFIIAIVWFVVLFFGYKIVTNEKKPEQIIAPTPIQQPQPQQTPIKINSGTTNNIQQPKPQETQVINTWLSQKDLDYMFCQKDNDSLNKYNDELLKENQSLIEQNKNYLTAKETCEKEKIEIDKKKDFLISIWQQINEKCKTANSEQVKKSCTDLVNNYFNYEHE